MLKKFIENIEVIDISSKGKGVCKDKSGKVFILTFSLDRLLIISLLFDIVNEGIAKIISSIIYLNL